MDNARALFERALNATSAAAAPKLWDAFLAFEYRHGKLPAALAIQVRHRREAARSQSQDSAAGELWMRHQISSDAPPINRSAGCHVS